MEESRLERKEVRRHSTPATVAGVSLRILPPELVEVAVGRLGFLGLVIALMGPAAFMIERAVQPERVAVNGGFPFQQWVAALLFVAGSLMCMLAWKRLLRPSLLLDVGLLFQVAVAFAISLTENATPWPAGHPIRGISWNCLWISMYLIAIPGTYGKSVLAAFSAACIAPFGLLLATVVNGNPIPSGAQLALLLLPPFAAAAWAIPVARHLYKLGAQASRARAMGSYELLDRIGQGGMGEVWRARHRMLARVSAIKLIRPEVLTGGQDAEDLRRRFEREARATAALTSPHTVSLYDYGATEDGSFYYAMELLDGLDLETLVRRFGPVPAGRAVYLLRQVTKSLAEAHENGLVHRDIKPQNIFACRPGADHDFVKVLDFGLVKISENGDIHTRLTRAGVTTGTPAYMAPEVAAGNPDIDGRTDIYSLGCVGYWLLTGHLVFDAPNAMAMALAHVQNTPLPPSRRTELDIPPALEDIILRCLRKNPAERPASARELFDLLTACQGVPPWTDEDAERWWQMHLPRKRLTSTDLPVSMDNETL